MLTLTLGPLALPVAPLLLLLSVVLAQQLGAWMLRHDPGAAATLKDQVFYAALAGLAVARVAFVLQAGSAYSQEPWRAFDIRDGGWLMLPGVLAAGLWVAWRALRSALLRRPLAVSSAMALSVWAVGSLGLGLNKQVDVPPVPLQSLSAGAQPQQASLAELARGRPTVIALWATWCGVCHQQMPHLAAAQQRQTDVQVLFINQGEDAARVQAYLQQQGLSLRQVWLDAASRTGPAVGSRGLPTTLFYNAQGELIHRQVGLISPPALARRIQDAAADRRGLGL